MARVVVGYEGEGSARRPVYRDDGPARARGSHDPSGLERLTGSPVMAFADPDRERAQVVAARREVWGESPGLRGTIQADAEQAKAWRAEADEEYPLDDPREVMERQVALLRAQDHEEATMIQPSAGVLGSGFGDLDVVVALPCEGCLHVLVCRIREELLAAPLGLVAHVLPAGITRDIVVELRCEYRLAAPANVAAIDQADAALNAAANLRALADSAEPAQAEDAAVVRAEAERLERTYGRPATPADPEAIAARREKLAGTTHATSPRHRRERRQGEARLEREEEQRRRAGKHALTPKQERVIELLREEDGEQQRAASRLGITQGGVSSLIKGIRAKGRMPADVEKLLAARSRPRTEASA